MWLITGTNGFIGSELVRKLNGKIEFIEFKGDLLSNEDIQKISKKITGVVHLAAQTDTGRRNHSVNVEGTKQLLKKLNTFRHRVKFIYISSQAVVVNNHNYARSKKRAEELVIQNKRIDYAIIRLCTIVSKNPKNGTFWAWVKGEAWTSRLNWPGKVAVMDLDEAVDKIIRLMKRKLKNKTYLWTKYNWQARADDIVIPNWGWQLIIICDKLFLRMEKILPYRIYNFFWRLSLLCEGVLAKKE